MKSGAIRKTMVHKCCIEDFTSNFSQSCQPAEVGPEVKHEGQSQLLHALTEEPVESQVMPATGKSDHLRAQTSDAPRVGPPRQLTNLTHRKRRTVNPGGSLEGATAPSLSSRPTSRSRATRLR
jgi:hypothetical protein